MPATLPAIATSEGFRPYRAAVSPMTRDEIFDACNRNMYHGYGPVVGDRPMAYPLLAYAQLLDAFVAMPRVEVVTLEELCRRPGAEGRVRLAIRHDVDGDIVAALAMARLEHERGLPTSYYMLHTASYHGRFARGTLHRHAGIAGVYREIEALGHEIGLHTDGLTVYQQWGCDGAQAIIDEVAWLRDQGLRVAGTVAHGSKSVFGAENYELFCGRRKGKARSDDPAWQAPERLAHAGSTAWLRVLDEAAIDLTYEGNDVLRQKAVPVAYGATRAVDGWRWNPYRDRRRAAGVPVPPQFCCQTEMLRDIAALTPGRCVMLTVHPCYYGLRHAADRPPLIRHRAASTVVSRRLGWVTHEPGAVHSFAPRDATAHDYQSMALANEHGMLDAGWPRRATLAAAQHRVLLVGGGALDGREVAVPSQTARVLEGMIDDTGRGPAVCRTLAHRGLDVTRAWGWLVRGTKRMRPTCVVLAITPDAWRDADPATWARATGFSATHPPGDYLVWREGAVVERRRARGWAIRRATPRPAAVAPCATEAPATRETPEALEAPGAQPPEAPGRSDNVLAAFYRHAATHVRANGATCLMMVTNGTQDAAFTSRAAGVARAADLTLVDPSATFAEHPAPAGLRHADESWSAEAHRLAAAALYDAIGP